MEHDHLAHYLLIFTPLVLAFIILLKDKLLNLSKFQVLVITLLVVFTAIHLNPAKLTFAYHHQTADSKEHHPCCIPQISDTTVPFEVFTSVTFVQESENNPNVFRPFLFTPSVNNRSPPVFS